MKQKKDHLQSVFLIAFFAIYMFEYMVTLTLIDKGGVAILPETWQLVLHYLDYALIMLGFLFFALLRRLPENTWIRKLLPVLASGVYGGSVLALYFTRDRWVYTAIALCAALFLGVLGGMVYYCMAAALADSPIKGRIMAVGNSLALILQYLFQEYFHVAVVLPVILVIGFGLVFYLIKSASWDWLTKDFCLKASSEKTKSRPAVRVLVFLCVISVCLYCIGYLFDRQLLLTNIRNGYGDMNLYSWPRLCAIIGIALAGEAFDRKKENAMPVVALCMALVAVLNPVLFMDARYYVCNLCLFYANLGASLGFYNLSFWHIAPRTKWPELWAGMGRIVTNLTSFLLLLVPLNHVTMQTIVAVDVIMLVIIVVCMSAGGLMEPGGNAAFSEGVDEEEIIRRYCLDYHLTPREGDVVRLLLNPVLGTEQIAETLGISRRMVQRYISSICEKVNVGVRMDILQHYKDYYDSYRKTS